MTLSFWKWLRHLTVYEVSNTFEKSKNSRKKISKVTCKWSELSRNAKNICKIKLSYFQKIRKEKIKFVKHAFIIWLSWKHKDP